MFDFITGAIVGGMIAGSEPERRPERVLIPQGYYCTTGITLKPKGNWFERNEIGLVFHIFKTKSECYFFVRNNVPDEQYTEVDTPKGEFRFYHQNYCQSFSETDGAPISDVDAKKYYDQYMFKPE